MTVSVAKLSGPIKWGIGAPSPIRGELNEADERTSREITKNPRDPGRLQGDVLGWNDMIWEI